MNPLNHDTLLVSRLCSLWSHVFASRERFEAEPSRGLIGKSLARPFNLVWNYLVKGALGTAILCAFIPVLTLLTVGGSFTVIVTAPLWAPGLALGQYVWDFLVWDEMTGELLPGPKALLWNIALNGVVNVAASLVGAGFHPVVGVGMYSGGALGLAVVAVWDWLMFWGLLRWHARIPASDTFLCRRIGGAGVAETYFVQVREPASFRCILVLGFGLADSRRARGPFIYPARVIFLFSSLFLTPNISSS